jgi:hypothetical protein
MRADRRTGSATATTGSETVQNLLPSDALRLQRRADLLRETQKDLTANLDRQLRRIPGKEEPSGTTFARHEDHVLGAKHLRGMIAEVANRYDLHVGTTVVTAAV